MLFDCRQAVSARLFIFATRCPYFRLRDAARRVATTRDPVTEIALDVGFEDLSNFIRSFRAEFGVPPSRYRAGT